MAGERYLALWSYVCADDEGDEGRIAALQERVQAELRIQAGHDVVVVFLDRKELHLGGDWRARLQEAVRDSLFLIPIVTPSYFNSTACRWELEQFLEREKLGARELVLPLYYVKAPLVDDPGHCEEPPAHQAGAARLQVMDGAAHLANTSALRTLTDGFEPDADVEIRQHVIGREGVEAPRLR